MREPVLYLDGRVRVYAGDCREVLKELPGESVDSVVTDPPYHLQSIHKRFAARGRDETSERYAAGPYGRHAAGFMGQKWDGGDIAFRPELWAEVLRILKPGGHLVSFAHTRTYHRTACAIEDAGFEIRDQIKFDHAWDAERIAFLESLSTEQLAQFAKLFLEDDALGQLAWVYAQGFPKSHDAAKAINRIARRVTPDRAKAAAKAWEGWGTALKPAWEPIVLARKPLVGSVAANLLGYGTGVLNIDGCRIHAEDAQGGEYTVKRLKPGATLNATGGNWRPEEGGVECHGRMKPGRWPANLVHDGSPDVLRSFPDSKSCDSPSGARCEGTILGGSRTQGAIYPGEDGSAARFYFAAKADADDRLGSKHPTVKPVDLMQWLVRLVTPRAGVVLDPFGGTGTTGEAAWREGMSAILIEQKPEYLADIARRMELAASPAKRSAVAAAAKKKVELGRIDDLPLFVG